jgi:hypothetical protein
MRPGCDWFVILLNGVELALFGNFATMQAIA